MKKHQACYWLNVIAEDMRRTIQYRQEEAEKLMADETADEKAREARVRYQAEQVKEYEQKLQAIDIAGEALTK